MLEYCAGDLGLILDKTVKLEWHRTNNTRTRCLRITQKVRMLSYQHTSFDTCPVHLMSSCTGLAQVDPIC